MIGYLLERELANAMPGRNVASLLTQTVVDALDPAFRKPTKPIGPVYEAGDALSLASERGWQSLPTATSGVASSRRRSRVRSWSSRRSGCSSTTTCWSCAPAEGVSRSSSTSDGARHGVEAVVDKDAATALVARDLDADLLLLLPTCPRSRPDGGPRFPTDRADCRARVAGAELCSGVDGSEGRRGVFLRERDGGPGCDRRTDRRRGTGVGYDRNPGRPERHSALRM